MKLTVKIENMTESEDKIVPALPRETIEHVLCFLDGKTLGSAEQVCVEWNRLCKLQKAKGWWKSCCKKEIPTDALYDILNKKYPAYFVPGNEDRIDWKDVYKRWLQWSQLHNYSVLCISTSLYQLERQLNMMKTSGCWVFLCSDHAVVAFHVNNSSYQIMYKTNCQIIDIDLKADVNSNTATSTSMKRVDNYEFQHKYLIVNMVESLSAEIDLRTKDETTRRYMQRSWAGKTVRVNSEFGSTNISVIDEMSSKVITKFSTSLFDDCDIFDFRNGVVLLKNCLGPYSVYAVNTDTQSMEILKESDSLEIKYSWHCSVLVGFISVWHGDMWLLVNGKKTVFNTHSEIHAIVTSVFFYNNNFIIGTDTGCVFIYEVTGTNGLLSLDLRNYKVKQKCADEPITCIEVIEKSDYPQLLILTEKKLTTMKFTQI